jgi:23S rRNA (guanosine2251-2'-O)-methyltransferase
MDIRRDALPTKQRFQPADLVGDDEEIVAGRHPVQEAFAARREAVRLLVVPERREALDNLVIHATTLRMPVVEVEGGTLTSLAGFDGHQGVALVVRRRPPATVDEILDVARLRGQPAFVLILDSLEDPQNLGTLLRSAEATGVHGVIYPARRAVPLTPAAIKASAGATEHLLLAPVENLGSTIADLRGRGLRTIGADQEASLSYSQADLRGPLAIVVGSEGFGISGQLRRRMDQAVRIPMRGKVASLNAAVAGSVLLFAAAEQRGEPASAPAQPVEDNTPADAAVDESS